MEKTINVTLRKAKVKGNRLSLYLDFYPPITNELGKTTRREYLGLYIWEKPTTKEEKTHNKDTLDAATIKRMEREKKLSSMDTPDQSTQEKGKKIVFEYTKEIAEKQKDASRDIWNGMINFLEAFLKEHHFENITFNQLSNKFCNMFRDYLQNTNRSFNTDKLSIKQNTRWVYLSKFKTMLNRAFKEEYTNIKFSERIENIKQEETQKNFLTLEELNLLSKTPCSSDVLKNACLFSALTGLRYSDILRLKWENVFEGKNGYEIQFKQKKTSTNLVHPISKQAHNLLGNRTENEEKCFQGIPTTPYISFKIKAWTNEAGIEKKITFHCFRHTFATLQLEAGTDIYTVSKMLGHKNLATTQIYAKIVDKTKREAANRIVIDI